MPFLSVRISGSRPLTVSMAGPETVIGRGDQADIELPPDDEFVSHAHATIAETGTGWLLTNLSKNGTLLNGRPVVEEALLSAGDTIRIGGHSLVFLLMRQKSVDRTVTTVPQGTAPVAEPARELRSDRWRLRAVSGLSKVDCRLVQEMCVLGSSGICDIVLKEKDVAPRHLTIMPSARGYKLFDHDSAGGTFVDGVKITTVELTSPAEIRLGKECVLRVEEYQEPAAPRPVSIFQGMIGSGPRMEEVFTQLEKAARSSATVLLNGESGTGKELAARALHNLSPRAPKPFVAVNVGAITRELGQSDLFGHAKGAFTGAEKSREGYFERADGGTLFLDEIGELPLEQQVLLLRVLETREVARVGGTGIAKVDVRIIAATHRNLFEDAEQGRFRKDLAYRLGVVVIELPALRDRPEDILPLARHLLAGMADDGQPMTMTPATERILQGEAWPGNVRDLRNVLERACVLGAQRGVIDTGDLKFLRNGRLQDAAGPAGQVLTPTEEAEKRVILAKLQEVKWNKVRAAEELGKKRTNLYADMDRLGIPLKRP